MTKNEIMDYVTETPHNINKNILGQKLDEYANQSGGGNAVQYVEQTLTEEQQMQARRNLGLYSKGIGEVDIIPEQQVTFENGSAEAGGSVLVDGDRSYHGCTATLVINGEEYEGILEYFDIAMFYRGIFGPYYLTMNNTFELGEGASVQNGDTVTVRLYMVDEVASQISTEYLPKYVASAVSYERAQELTDLQKNYARRNIDATNSYCRNLVSAADLDSDGNYTIVIEENGLFHYSFLIIEAERVGISDGRYGICMIPFLGEYNIKQHFELSICSEEPGQKANGYIVYQVSEDERSLFVHIDPLDGKTWEDLRVRAYSIEYR